MQNIWFPSSWQFKSLHQQPVYKDKAQLKYILNRVSSYPPLVSIKEIKKVKAYFKEAATGKGLFYKEAIVQRGSLTVKKKGYNHS